jgi:CBS domain containing-hemolysin-like protein
MALVIDEFGATGGLVTIEDLIEEVFGEIEDEHAASRPVLLRQEDGSYLADARLPLEDLQESLDERLAVPNENAHSLGGLILWTAGRLPSAGDRIPHTPSGFEFEVLSVHQHRISKVRIRRMGKNQNAEKAGVRAA